LEFGHRFGKGGALVEGFKAARGKHVGFTDADKAVSPDEFYKLVEKLRFSEAEGVIGSRRVKGAKILKKQPLLRRLASNLFNLFVRKMCGFDYKDTQCGAKVFKKRFLQGCFLK
jgi:glycosyltransferase involved in cell wall biosynthesis